MSKKNNLLYLISGIIVIASTIAYIMEVNYAVYAFAIGAIGMIGVRISKLEHSTDKRISRLHKIQALGTILLLASAYLMYINHQAWVMTLVLSATFDLIVSYRMPSNK